MVFQAQLPRDDELTHGKAKIMVGWCPQPSPSTRRQIVSSVEHDLSDCKAPSMKSKDYHHPARVAVVFE